MSNRTGMRIIAVALALAVAPAFAATYEVTVTNLTPGQTFTPLLVVSHAPTIRLFETGQPASAELETVAEAGDIGPLEALAGTVPRLVRDTNTNGGLLGPGETTTIKIEAGGRFGRISLVGMLIPTNDNFVAVDSLPIPRGPGAVEFLAPAYDAGTEANDQNCANIPGPRCMGEGLSEPADGDEGYVHIGSGFHDLGTVDGEGNEILGPQTYDWNNPVARVVVQRDMSDASDEESDDESDD